MALTNAEKVEVRRHCGFPIYGAANATPPAFGYRFNTWFLTLEYRMNNMSVDEEEVLRDKYLANCNSLEDAIPTASENLDTDRAAVWYHNKQEVQDRFNLYKLWCERLIEFLGLESPSKLLGGMRQVI